LDSRTTALHVLPPWDVMDSFDLAVPATYVTDTQSTIQMACVDPD